jgi:hypothetical protein
VDLAEVLSVSTGSQSRSHIELRPDHLRKTFAISNAVSGWTPFAIYAEVGGSSPPWPVNHYAARVEVRPAGGGSGGQLMVTIVAWAILTLAVLVGTPLAVGQMGLIIDIPIAVVAVVAGGVSMLYLRNERVGVESGSLYRVNPVGLRRRWAISNLSEVVRARVLTGGGQMPTSVLDADLLIDKRGRTVASFTGVWPEEAMTELWRAAALSVNEPWLEPVTVQAIRQRFPGALPTLQEFHDEGSLRGMVRQPVMALAALLGLAVVSVVVFVVAVIVTAECQAIH